MWDLVTGANGSREGGVGRVAGSSSTRSLSAAGILHERTTQEAEGPSMVQHEGADTVEVVFVSQKQLEKCRTKNITSTFLE